MRKLLVTILCIFVAQILCAQNFQYAFVTDTHVGSGTGEEDLRRTVDDINSLTGLDFAIFTGDITEMGTDKELALAASIIKKIRIPCYVIPGNHDTGWSESGGVSFIKDFGADKLVFDHKGYRFIGCASGPYVRMSDGHIPRDAVVWLDSVLAVTPKDEPIVFFNHYPLDDQLDNWYEATDRLKKHRIAYAICGHGHQNLKLNFEGIPATMGRSNLRAKDPVGGYTLVSMRPDSVLFTERNPVTDSMHTWRSIALNRPAVADSAYKRPTFRINEAFPNSTLWSYHSAANVISTPLVAGGMVVFGNSVGLVQALDESTGKPVWSFRTGGSVLSSPAADGRTVIFGSGDGSVYALDLNSGKKLWQTKTGASVLGAVAIKHHTAYLGGSDHHFHALDTRTGRERWSFGGLNGPVVCRPLLTGNKIIFGAWDKNLYALDTEGHLQWTWTNGQANRMYSPAMVNPVEADGVVYIAAPDRYLTAIDLQTGKTLWRVNGLGVRESIGLSADKKLVYGKTMQDSLIAYRTGRKNNGLAWKMNCGFGYEHVPSMLIEKKGLVYFGTKNGVVYAINPKTRKVQWLHKMDNSMVNTVNVLRNNKVLAATMDGKVELLQAR